MRRLGIVLGLAVLMAVALACDRPGAPLPTAPSGTVVLTYERTGGIAGFQDRLVIGAKGEYFLVRGGQERIGSIDESRRKALDTWSSQYAAFTLTLEDNPGGPDNMKRQVIWAGAGGNIPTGDMQREILDWASGVMEQLTAR